MVTATSPLSRQPTKLDYVSPTQFRFGINQLPKVEFFTTEANLPGITAGVATVATPFKDIPTMLVVDDNTTIINQVLYKKLNQKITR